ncbi:MAG: hypothetical protein H7222_12115 [Methylotenera sp.]|nr:hypothetical protein [Oligoflexia bacterium]
MNRIYRARKIILLCMGLSLLTVALRADEVSVSLAGYPGGAQVSEYSRIEVPEGGLELKEPTDIHVDELVLKGPLITNGFKLVIDVQNLVFENGGNIVAFKGPAEQGPLGKAGPDGETGEHGTNKSNNPHGHKGHTPGKPGETGGDAQTGKQDPGSITVIAANTSGQPVLDGTGQKGGKAGLGGKGGVGGRGGRGGQAETKCIGHNHSAGRGGQAGTGGTGGMGGRGGDGGKAVQISFVQGELSTTPQPILISRPGSGGEPGDAGVGGEPGEAGEGGGGDSSNCLGWTEEEDGGDTGPPGESGRPGTAGTLSGKSGPHLDEKLQKSTPDHQLLIALETERSKTFQSWYRFHVSRTLYLLTQDSLRLVHQTEMTRAELQTLAEDDFEFATMLKATDANYAEQVINAWKNDFLDPLTSQLEVARKDPKNYGPAVIRRLNEALTAGLDLQKLLSDPVNARQSLQKLLGETQSRVADDLNQALLACSEYNTALKDQSTLLAGVFFGMTGRYEMGPCNGSIDFADAANLFAEIKLSQKIDSKDTSAWLQGMIQLAKPAVPRDQKIASALPLRPLRAVQALLTLPMAYAQEKPSSDPDVYFFGKSPLSKAQVLTAIPTRKRLTSGTGILTGYAVPAEAQLNRASLSLHLRALSILLGERSSK